MNAFTKTTKGKVFGLVLATAAIIALAATIVFLLAGETNHAIPTASMFFSILTLIVTTASYLNRKEAEARTAARRARLYA